MVNGTRQDALHCVNCREEVRMVGPETWHTESTMIRCDIPGDTKWAEVNWSEFNKEA